MTRREDAEALAAAARPKSCRKCGRTFATGSAWTVHFSAGEGSECLPGDAYGQLVQVDGVWRLAGTGR